VKLKTENNAISTSADQAKEIFHLCFCDSKATGKMDLVFMKRVRKNSLMEVTLSVMTLMRMTRKTVYYWGKGRDWNSVPDISAHNGRLRK
jgi:hypothetical protein